MSTKSEEESLDSGSRSSEHESATGRINNALQKIRSELSEIRDQDLKLLKQLIQISETIKRLSEDRLSKRRTWYGQRQSVCSESAELYLDIEPLTPDLDDYREAILVRQFSEPVSFSRDDLLDMRTNLSIFDGPIALDSSDTMDQSWPPNFSRVQLRHRPHSVSILTSSRSYGMDNSQERIEGSDKSYEEILQRNIRLWKGRQSVHTSDDEEDGSRTPVNDWSFFSASGRRSSVSLTEVKNTSEKRNSNRGSSSSCSSVINSSGSSYSSSAVNGDSSRSSSCSSFVFNGVNAGVGETTVSDVGDNNFSDVENIAAENSSVNLTSVDGTAENDVNFANRVIVDVHCSGDVCGSGDTKKQKDDENDCQSVGDDGDQTPVIEPVNEWLQGNPGRNEEKSDEETEKVGEFEMRVPDRKERGVLKETERVSGDGDVAASVREGAIQIRGGAKGIRCKEEEGPEVRMMQERELDKRGDMAGAGKQMIREEEKAVAGRGAGSREGEKERGRERGKDGAGGDKSKGKESSGSSGGSVVRALLDHIGRKIENRVTVGMAEYSRSFLPVISEISKRDGRQKAGAHRPRELDITE